MARFVEDVEVRCKTCAKAMGSVTARSENQSDIDKIVWINTNIIRCQDCAKK